MRPERVTQRNVAAAYEAVKRVYHGPLQLPALDMGEMFAGRKSVTWRAALKWISAKIDIANGL